MMSNEEIIRQSLNSRLNRIEITGNYDKEIFEMWKKKNKNTLDLCLLCMNTVRREGEINFENLIDFVVEHSEEIGRTKITKKILESWFEIENR